VFIQTTELCQRCTLDNGARRSVTVDIEEHFGLLPASPVLARESLGEVFRQTVRTIAQRIRAYGNIQTIGLVSYRRFHFLPRLIDLPGYFYVCRCRPFGVVKDVFSWSVFSSGRAGPTTLKI
jgi:hypothetical protein